MMVTPQMSVSPPGEIGGSDNSDPGGGFVNELDLRHLRKGCEGVNRVPCAQDCGEAIVAVIWVGVDDDLVVGVFCDEQGAVFESQLTDCWVEEQLDAARGFGHAVLGPPFLGRGAPGENFLDEVCEPTVSGVSSLVETEPSEQCPGLALPVDVHGARRRVEKHPPQDVWCGLMIAAPAPEERVGRLVCADDVPTRTFDERGSRVKAGNEPEDRGRECGLFAGRPLRVSVPGQFVKVAPFGLVEVHGAGERFDDLSRWCRTPALFEARVVADRQVGQRRDFFAAQTRCPPPSTDRHADGGGIELHASSAQEGGKGVRPIAGEHAGDGIHAVGTRGRAWKRGDRWSRMLAMNHTTDLVVGDDLIRVHVAAPDPPAANGQPAVIVLHELFGVNPDIRNVLDQFTDRGFVAVAPELFHRAQPEGVWLERKDEGRARGFELLGGLDRASVLADVNAVLGYLGARDDVTGPVTVAGFSLGGHVAYLAATALPIDRTIVLYGGWLTGTDIALSRPEPTIDLTRGIASTAGRVLMIVGADDHLITGEQVDQIREALEATAVDHEVLVLPGVGHAFFWPATPNYDEAAVAESWVHIDRFVGVRAG